MDKSPKPSKAQAPQSGLVHRMFGLRVGGSQPRADKDAGERKAADSGTPTHEKTISYSAERIVDNGSFGVVFQAQVVETGEVVAIKKVLQDQRFKNRELQIMRKLRHPNVVELRHCFYSHGQKPDELYLNLVMEYVPETVYRVTRHYQKRNEHVPILSVKLYMYQACRSLAYIHALGVCHRDIKPQNLLVNPETNVLKLCDFGSAKVLVKGEPNISYICSRYYRAPELIFGATDYTTAVDVWSIGCVCAEMLLGQPLFPGESGVDQLVEIIKVLGTPSRAHLRAMNPNYTNFNFPKIKPYSLRKLFRSHTPPEAVDLLSKLLLYNPTERLRPLEACLHPFFDELRDPATRLPNGAPLPPLFNFTDVEMSADPELVQKLVPEHARTPDNWPPRPARATPLAGDIAASSAAGSGSMVTVGSAVGATVPGAPVLAAAAGRGGVAAAAGAAVGASAAASAAAAPRARAAGGGSAAVAAAPATAGKRTGKSRSPGGK